MIHASKHKIAADFSRTACEYESHAQLQKQAREGLCRRMPSHSPQSLWLDAGCGPGPFARDFGALPTVSLDIAAGMAQFAKHHGPAVNADMEQLPFADERFDGIFSSLAAQWLPATTPFWQEGFRVAKPGGQMIVATLVKGTLRELRQAYQKAALPATLLDFLPAKLVTDAIRAAGWNLISAQEETLTTQHPSVFALLQHFKKLGANASPVTAPSLRHRGDIATLAAHYPLHSTDRTLHASWQLLYIVAEKGRK